MSALVRPEWTLTQTKDCFWRLEAQSGCASDFRIDEYGRKTWTAAKAAEAGNWKAMFNLAVAYHKGQAGL